MAWYSETQYYSTSNDRNSFLLQTSTITHKFLGSNSNRSGQQQQPSNNQHNFPGPVGDIFGKITTTIGNKLNSSSGTTHQQQQQQMYGNNRGYPPQQPTNPGAYPPPGNVYNANSAPPPPIGFNLGVSNAAPPYPQQSAYNQPAGQYAPYPTASGQYGDAAPYPVGGGFGAQQPQQQYFGSGYPNQQSKMSGPAPYGSDPFAMATPSIRPNPNFNSQQTAELLRKAMKGFGCDKGKIIQAIVNCSNVQRQEVSLSFKQMYGKDLIKELKSELSGDFEDLIMALMSHPAYYDAAQLRRAMEGLGTKEHILIEIMTTRTNAQIIQLRSAYAQLYCSDLERDMIGETSGYFKRMLVALCTGARDESMIADPLRANQDANKLYRAGEARLGTDESAFIAILSAQNYNQLRLIFNEYQKVSGHPIEQAIAAEFSGDIRDGLLAIIKSIKNRPAYFAELLYNSMKGFGTRDTDLIRLVVTRSEIDLADIRSAYQQLYGTSLEQAIASDCSGAYKDGLIAIVKGFYH
uniref:Annexin n=1 Tax=Meloidogyne javanica TaxID=6303 RepID=A0A915N140_MELJA